MNQKHFLQAVFQSDGILSQNIMDSRLNPLIDYTHDLIRLELDKVLDKAMPKEKRDKLEEEILSILIDLSDYSARIGVDTATMLLAGVDPYNTFSKPEKRKNT